MRFPTLFDVICSWMVLTAGSTAAGDIIWDNGDWDPNISGAGGESHLLTESIDRRVLSDFWLDTTVTLTGFTMDGVWTSGNTLLGTGIRLWLRVDRGNAPGEVIREFTTGNYNEVKTGGTAFSRPLVRSTVDIADEPIGPGAYWLEMQMQGPENYFQMTSFGKNELIGEETWANYSDFGGLQPFSSIKGHQFEVNWKLFGVIPSPTALTLFAVAGSGARRRRRV